MTGGKAGLEQVAVHGQLCGVVVGNIAWQKAWGLEPVGSGAGASGKKLNECATLLEAAGCEQGVSSSLVS